MKIIIIGCGKVGTALAEQLCREKHDIVMIDSKASAIHNITDTLDVMGIVGNGASNHTQRSAGIEEADLLIAVTGSDELNLLCCLIAQNTSDCHTVARVRSPQYNDEIEFIKEGMGISLIINPELETAIEISRLVRLPSAIKIDTFSKGKVELLKYQIPQGSPLENLSIMNIPTQLHSKVLVCAVERRETVFIPNGNFVLKSGDIISIVATPKNAVDFFRRVCPITTLIRDVMLVGGGNIAVYLAHLFKTIGISVKIIEQNRERCEELSDMLPEALIIHANASDNNILLEEGIRDMDAFISLTNFDEENILLSLYAQKISKAKVFTKITRLTYDDIIVEMPLGIIVNPKTITADRILQHVRAMQNPKGSNVETLYKIVGNQVEALEFRVKDNNPKLTGIPLEKLETKDNLLVTCINRKDKIIIPNGKDSLQKDDTVIIVTTNTGLDDLSDILA